MNTHPFETSRMKHTLRTILTGQMLCYRAYLSILLLAAVLLSQQPLSAYSVQTHEQLIDLSWKNIIKPFILRRFPHATDADLERAHAFAYGGCAIQDLGYYPFSKEFFSDLTHYVRSGDFVAALFQQARNPDELAFAIGALSHYVGDINGHRVAVNPSVAIEFPNLAHRYGDVVTYDENPHAHVRTEFAFDINEITKHRMAPSAYLRHVGLKVPSTLLTRAFFETYGLHLESILGKRRRPVVRTYRFAVRSFLPRIAYAETVLHRSSFPPDQQTPAFAVFQQNLAAADFAKGWDQYRKKAGIGTHLLAWTIFILPKVGPLSLLAIRGPIPETHERYIESVNAATESLRHILENWRASPSLPNRDLDTGAKVRPGGYRLTDQTYAKLLATLTSEPARALPGALKQDVLDYYSDPRAPISTKLNPAKWAAVQRQLIVLRGMKVRS